MDELRIICLTPVKNGEWMIEKFIKCASLWADKIIISDQNSTDNTISICENFEKVQIIKNDIKIFDEIKMRQKLLDEARKIKCEKRIIIYLDSDEILSSDFLNSIEWKTILKQEKGTFFTAKLINYFKSFDLYFEPDTNFFFGFIDSEELFFDGNKIHGPRVPLKWGSKIINLNEIRILHFPYVNFKRLYSKYLWYKCVELINNDFHGSMQLNKKYDINNLNKNIFYKSKEKWLQGYTERGIDVFSEVNINKYDWYLDQVILFYSEYGVKKFQFLDIWEVDWELVNKNNLNLDINFKRSLFSKVMRKFSKITRNNNGIMINKIYKILEKII